MKAWQVELVTDRVLVTGGGSGIGRHVALTLASLGARTYVLGRRAEALEETARLAGESGGSVVPISADARDPDSLARAFAAVEEDGGPVGALVHGAASVEYCPARDLEPAAFREVIDSILLGTFNTIHRWAAPLLDEGLPGVGLALTSCIAARGTPGAAHSSAAKAGVEAMVRTIAREWGPAGVRLNAVGPGFFPVERTQAMWDDPEVCAPIQDLIALGRPGTLDEITGPIVFLLTEAATYFTGEVLVPDGGFHLTPHVLPRWRFA